MKKRIFMLLLCMLLLSGCGNLSQTLTKKAEHYASGKQEENYYFQSSGYRMKELLAVYTAGYRKLIWEYGELKQETEPDGWDQTLVVSSDSCVSSSREMHQVLADAFTSAALGVSLQFDRSNFLPKQEEIEAWINDYVMQHPLDALGIGQITVYQKETVSDRILYFVFSYETDLNTIRELRTQTEEAAGEFVTGVKADMMSEEQKAEAVWNFLTEQVLYPKEGDISDAYRRADGAMLEKKANAQGFASAASLLFNMLELENGIAAEVYETETGEELLRVQNRVKVDGDWYRMDCCFGAVTGGSRDFFLIKEETE